MKKIINNIKNIKKSKNIEESKSISLQQEFDRTSQEFYNAEIKRNKLRIKNASLKKEMNLIGPKGKEEIIKLENKIRKIDEKINKLEEKREKNKQDLEDKKNHIKNNPSIKKDIFRKGKAYNTQISFLKLNKKDLESKLKQIRKINGDDKKLELLNEKRNKNKQKISSCDDEIKIIEKKYLFLKDKINKEHSFKRREDISFSINNLNAYYGSKKSLHNISLDLPRNKVIALIGASGSGKSTLLRTLNRINDEIPSFRAKGEILYHDYLDVLNLENKFNSLERISVSELRTKVGMVFQQPNPFPMSIYKNVIYGPKINGIKGEAILQNIAESTLKRAALWDEVKDNLSQLGTSLSGGQQQRLCIARAIANNPDVLLMDEPTSALDPKSAAKIEELILELKNKYTIIIVTHSMQQAQRISDNTAFMHDGYLIEYDTTKNIFNNPKNKRTKDYISGKFG